jgi:ribosomal-protein-serine acetyltransferase
MAPGLELRTFEGSDADTLFCAVDGNRARLREWLDWVDTITSVDDQRADIEAMQGRADRDEGFLLGLWEDGQLRGAIGLDYLDHRNRATQIGYWLTKEAEGRGLMTRACRALLAHLFDELHLHRVVIHCGTGNTRSAAIPRRLGFKLEGRERESGWLNDRWIDTLLWAILEDEWRAGASS